MKTITLSAVYDEERIRLEDDYPQPVAVPNTRLEPRMNANERQWKSATAYLRYQSKTPVDALFPLLDSRQFVSIRGFTFPCALWPETFRDKNSGATGPGWLMRRQPDERVKEPAEMERTQASDACNFLAAHP